MLVDDIEEITTEQLRTYWNPDEDDFVYFYEEELANSITVLRELEHIIAGYPMPDVRAGVIGDIYSGEDSEYEVEISLSWDCLQLCLTGGEITITSARRAGPMLCERLSSACCWVEGEILQRVAEILQREAE